MIFDAKHHAFILCLEMPHKTQVIGVFQGIHFLEKGNKQL